MGCTSSKKKMTVEEMRESNPEGLKKELIERHKLLLKEKEGINPLIAEREAVFSELEEEKVLLIIVIIIIITVTCFVIIGKTNEVYGN